MSRSKFATVVKAMFGTTFNLGSAIIFGTVKDDKLMV